MDIESLFTIGIEKLGTFSTVCLFLFCKHSDFLSQHIVILSHFTHRKYGISSTPCDKNERQRSKNLILLNRHLNYFQNFRKIEKIICSRVQNHMLSIFLVIKYCMWRGIIVSHTYDHIILFSPF